MRYIVLVWICSITLLLGQATPLKNFYSSLKNNLILKMEIDFFQKQFENTFESSGLFYLIAEKKYVYDSSSFQMIVDDSLVTTINHLTNQVIYSSIEKGQLSILDILSGNKDYIKFFDQSNDVYINKFNMPDLGYSGTFEFDQDTGLIKLIRLFIDYDQNVLITVTSIEYIEEFIPPNFNREKFEIIDLRG